MEPRRDLHGEQAFLRSRSCERAPLYPGHTQSCAWLRQLSLLKKAFDLLSSASFRRMSNGTDPVQNNSTSTHVMKVMLYSANYLLEKVATGDQAAFRELYRIYAGALYGVILTNTTSETLACQALERTFVRIWCNCVVENNHCSFMWMVRIARSEALVGQQASLLTPA